MASRGKLLVAMAIKRSIDSEINDASGNDFSDDDSDRDPDYVPETKIRKYEYFNENDLLEEISDYDNSTNFDPETNHILFDMDIVKDAQTQENDVTGFITSLLIKMLDAVITHSCDGNTNVFIISSIVIPNDNLVSNSIDKTGYCQEVSEQLNIQSAQEKTYEFISNIVLCIIEKAFIDSVSNKKKKQTRTEKSKIQKNLNLRKVLPPCTIQCRKKCGDKLNKLIRQNILEKFWNLNFSQRRLFLDSHIKQKNVKSRTSATTPHKRNSTYNYFLPLIGTSSKEETPVCKIMFLHTLGMKTDGMITEHFRAKNALQGGVKTTDDRGKSAREALQINKDQLEKKIKDHVELYNPVVSHYKFVHAPKRRYLTCDLSVSTMWKDFCVQYKKVSYEKYRAVFDSMNVGFDSPSQDDCGACSVHSQHKIETDNHQELKNCTICENYEQHRIRYTSARQEYTKDKEFNWPSEFNVYTVDMQKVLIIPKMPIKNSFFISRLVVFNETFAALHHGKNLCLIWNEAIQGRNAPDVTSTYYHVIRNANPDVMHFIFWADNCSAQNKNWVLYSSMICIVNATWGPSRITFKYFEPGHSFMKSDSVHGQIGSEWKKRNKVLDMNDMIDVINKSSKNNIPILLHYQDFIAFKDGCKQRRRKVGLGEEMNIPLLEKIKIAEFRKGSKSMFYKQSYDQDDFLESQFLKNKFSVEIPESSTCERGISTKKKERIVEQLCQHMSERKKLFWKELSTNDSVQDLCFTSAE